MQRTELAFYFFYISRSQLVARGLWFGLGCIGFRVCGRVHAKKYPVDNDRIYLVGGSGGGHARLLMAGRRPDLFSAISSWCPISDLTAWYEQILTNPLEEYDEHIATACGGNLLIVSEAMKQAKHRSPITWIENAKVKVILDIGTGIHDGHTGSVPVSHAVKAFDAVEDPAYGPHKVLLRKTFGKVRLTLFEGGHDFLSGTAFGFLERQVRRAEPVWYSGDAFDTDATRLAK